MAGLDISARCQPQDGRTHVRTGDQVVNLRVATSPTMWGEKVSVRLLTKDLNLNLEALGLCDRDQKTFAKIISDFAQGTWDTAHRPV